MLYRFTINLSDIDRGIYEELDLRLAQHPSESITYLITRMLAYVLTYQEGLEFTPSGLSDPDLPALWAKTDHGSIRLWIEVGSPSARRLHKATKTATQVIVYTYKKPEVLLKEVRENDVFKAETIQFYAFDPDFLLALEKNIEKNNRWSILVQEGQISVNIGSETHIGVAHNPKLNSWRGE
jgi:uncharacterized protein YaeQ